MKTFNLFTKIEDELITKACKAKHIDWCALANVTGRDVENLIQRSFQLGQIRFNDYQHVLLSHRSDGWRSDEIEFLIENAGKMNSKEMAVALDRSIASISKQLYEFRLTKGNQHQWDAWELKLLREHINSDGVLFVSRKTFRSQMDVRYTALKMGITKKGMLLMQLGNKRRELSEEAAA